MLSKTSSTTLTRLLSSDSAAIPWYLTPVILFVGTQDRPSTHSRTPLGCGHEFAPECLLLPSSTRPPLRPIVSVSSCASKREDDMGVCLSLLSGTRGLLEGHLVDDLALLLLFDAVALLFLGSLLGLDPARSGSVGQVEFHGGV
jgi:hypothetical protein